MPTRWSDFRVVWLSVGVLTGLVIAFYWPHEEAHAIAVDRSSKMALVSANLGLGSGSAVFVLDFVTGKLVGAAPNPTGSFTQSYYRNLAADFKVEENAQYAIVPGAVVVQQRGGPSLGSDGLYVAELNSGVVALYAVPFNQNARAVVPTVQLLPVGSFNFKQTTAQ